MARPIDEKIVAMKMDNSDFKRKASETTSLFGKMVDSLNKIPGVNLGKVTKSFDGLQRSADKVDFSSLGRGIDNIADRFSAMSVIGTTALATVANKATNVGMGLLDSLGIGQIMSGFREYETKIGATNTMLFNTKWEGNTLEDVNKALKELNEYADKTTYNFGQMTQSIGKFTTAGIGLQDSTTAIKGLGNLAALSGANPEQYNRALYQVSQALQGDYFMAIDWNSIEEAQMGGQYTRESLIETAKAMGKVVDESVPFRQSLKDGWLTSEVFIETMRKFGNDPAMTDAATKVRTFTQFMDNLKESIGSGWAESWEIILGDFDEATERFTGLSDFFGKIFGKMGDDRNKFLSKFFEGDGLINMFDGIANVVKPIGQLLSSIGDGFKLVFPTSAGDNFLKFLGWFKDLTEGLKLSEATVKNLTTIFSGFFSIFAIGIKVIQGALSIVFGILPAFSSLGAMILELVAKVANIPLEFNKSIDSTDAFGYALKVLKVIAGGIASTLEFLVGGVISFVDATSKFSKESGLIDFLKRVGSGFSKLGDYILSLELSMEPISKMFSDLVSGLKSAWDWITGTLSTLGTAIKNAIPSGSELFAGGLIAGMIAVVGMALKLAWDFLQVFTGWGKVGASVSELLESVGGAFEGFALQVKSQALLIAAAAIGILALSFWSLSKLKPSQITSATYAMVGALMALVGSLAIMTKYDITGTGLKAVAQIMALSVAFTLLSVGLKNISTMNWNEIAKGLTGLIGIMGTFAGAVMIMGRFGGPQLAGSALQMVALAGTVFILVQAIKKIAEEDMGVMLKGMAGLAGVLAIFTTAVSAMSKMGGSVAASSLQLIAIAGSVLMLVQAIKQIAEIDTPNLLIGLATIGAILTAIAAFSLVTKNSGILSAGAGITLLAVALNLLVVPILALGSMSLPTLAKGLGAMAIALVAIGAASMMMTGMVAAGAGLILLATGMTMLLGPITAFSMMSLGQLAIGIGALAVGILAIGGAAILLGGAAPALLLGAAGIAAVGVALLAAGAGIALFSTGLVTLSTMTAAAVTTIVATLGTMIVGLATLIPKAVEFMYQLVNEMAQAAIDHIPVFVDKFMTLMTAVISAISTRLPEFATSATNLIVAFLKAMETEIPRIIEAVANLMMSLAQSVRENGPVLIAAWLMIMSEVVLLMVKAGVSVVNALFGWLPLVKKATSKIGETAESTIREAFGAAAVGAQKGTDFSTALAGTSGGAQAAGEGIGNSAENGSNMADLFSIGDIKGTDFANALANQSGSANTSGVTLGNAGKDGASSISMTDAGINFGKGFAGGMSSGSVLDSVIAAGRGLASMAKSAVENWLVIKSPSRVMDGVGQDTGQGFAQGITKKEGAVATASKDVAKTAKDNFEQEMDDAEYNFKMETISADEYIAELGRIKNAYSAYPELVKEVNLEIKSAEDDAYEHRQKLIKKEFQADKEYISDRKYYNELSLAEELELWEAMTVKYQENAELRKEADREVYRVKNALIDEQWNKEKQMISDRKYYNEASLTQELMAWEYLMNKYEEGTEQRKEAEREVYRLKNEINRKLIDLNEDYASKVKSTNDKMYADIEDLSQEYEDGKAKIREEGNRELLKLEEDYNSKVEDAKQDLQDEELKLKDEYLKKVEDANDKLIQEEQRLNDEYDKQLKQRTDSLVNYTGLFDRAEPKYANGEELLYNLKTQVDMFDQWSSDIATLSERGIDEGLIAKLEEMGPKSASEIQALNKLTDEQLNEYSDIWVEKNEKAHEQATLELEGLREDTNTQILQLRRETNNNLETYKNEWLSKTAQLRAENKELLAGYKDDWLSSSKEIRDGVRLDINILANDVLERFYQIKSDASKQLSEYKTIWLDKIKEVKEGTKDEFVDIETSMQTIGQNAIEGMMRGMDDMKGPLTRKAKEIAESVTATIKGALDINSPSRVTRALGGYTGEGLALGINDKIKSVADKSKEMALTAKDSLNRFLDGFQLPDDNNELRLKVVVDYDELDSRMFDDSRSIAFRPDTSFANASIGEIKSSRRQNDYNNPRESTNQKESSSRSTVVEQNLNFYSRELSPSEVARKNRQASRSLARDLEV